MITDALGNPLFFILTGGERNDITQAEYLTIGFICECDNVLADRGYDSDDFVQGILDHVPSLSFRLARTAPNSETMISISTKNGTLLNASSVKSNIFAVFSLALRSWPVVFVFPELGRCSHLVTMNCQQNLVFCGLSKPLVMAARETLIVLPDLRSSSIRRRASLAV